MVAAENRDAEWQRWREERMRFEVLLLIYSECSGDPGCIVRVSDMVGELGVWREELYRVLEFLDRRGYIIYHGAGPRISITHQGLDFIRHNARRRRSIRD